MTMLRHILISLSLIVLANNAFAGNQELTGKTLIKGDRVTVGDLFTNAGKYENYVLAPTPKAGEKLVLTKNDLQRVVKAFNLDWDVPQNDINVTLERDAVIVDEQDIIAALAGSDLKENLTDDASFILSNFSQPLVFEGQEAPELIVADTAFDAVTEKFSATVKVKRHGEFVKEFPVKGSATPMVLVPVLRNPVNTNALITESDIVMITIPKRDIRSDAITLKDDLVGMAPKRFLIAKQAISKNDVTAPIVVKRNELITVTYRNGPVSLSTKARALANGSKGDTVTMQNVTSKKSFEAKITGPQQAEVLADALDG